MAKVLVIQIMPETTTQAIVENLN